MFQRFFLLLLLGVFLPLSGNAYAEPKLNASLAANRIQQTETASLNLEIAWSKAEGSYGFTLPEPDLENLSLVRRGESQEFFNQDGQDWIRKSFELELKPLGPGTAAVREFTIRYVDTATQRQGSFQVTEMRLTVEKTPASFQHFRILAAAGIMLLAAGATLTVLFTKKKAKPAPESLVTKEDLLAGRIKSMIDSRRATQETFHLIAAEFRQFVCDYFKTGQTHATEDEVIRVLKSQNIPFEEFQKVKGLLEKIQEAKYLPEPSAAGDYKYLQEEILIFIKNKRILQSTNAGAT